MCECNTPTCCGASCETTHQNGLGQSFYDCTAPGVPGVAATYTVALADEARAASTITGTDLNAQCGSGGNAPQCVARQSATECVVWCYTKTVAGYVHDDTTSNMCFCPTPLTDPTWN